MISHGHRTRPIVIAGAGVAGLTAALSLHRAGVTDIRLLEVAPRGRPMGVGLNILPNAVRELAELGLLDDLTTRSICTSTLELRHCSGGLVWSEPRGLDAGYRWPQLSIHREVLLQVLRAAVVDRLGPQAIESGQRVVAGEPARDGVVVRCRDVVTQQERAIEASLLIGADGIHSALRAQFYPSEGAPKTNGLALWRGTAWSAPFADGRTMVVTGDDRRRVVIYPVRAGDDGRVLTNWVTTVPQARAEGVLPGDRASHVSGAFGGWVTPGDGIADLIEHTDEVVAHPMIDRDPIPRWVFGRCVLIGDAAHPMYPAGSNGATQAIVDARVLVLRLTQQPVDEALAAFEAERRPSLTGLQQANRRLGPELAISLAHQRAPDGFTDIHEVMGLQELSDISAQYAELGGFTANVLNARASHDPFPAGVAA